MTLRDEVMYAFAKVPRPADSALTSCNCSECRWEVARFRGKTWHRLTTKFFDAEDGGANLAALTPQAFVYFLPGLILLMLDEPNCIDWLGAEILRRLTASDHADEAERRDVDRVIRSLSPRQRQVILEWLDEVDRSELSSPIIRDSVVASLHDGRVVPYDSEARTEEIPSYVRRLSRPNDAES